MTTLSDEELLSLNRRGLIPGPNESEADFIQRAHYCLPLKSTMGALLGKDQPYFQEEPTAEEVLPTAFPKTVELYDIRPDWIPLFFSNYKLLPWHGGCAWIFQETEDSPTAAFFQLRQAFRKSTHYLGLYSREELIAHELAHVGRMTFNEPKFEEVIAYHSSPGKIRHYLGPLVQAPWEIALFLFVIVFILLLDLALLAAGLPHAFHAMLWIKAIPLAMLLFAGVRLFIRQRQFANCLDKLETLLGSRQKANAVIYRLQDEEIIHFGKMSSEALQNYVQENKHKSLRWRLLSLAYF